MTSTPDDGAAAELERLFTRVERLADSELIMLRSVWETGDARAREAAWRRVKSIVGARRRTRLLDEARARLAAWVNNYLTATTAEYGNFLVNAGSGMDPATIRRQALPPLLDAVAAAVAADGLSDPERAALVEPFAALAESRPS